MLLSDTLLDGTSSLGPFEVAHGFGHCTIQVSPDTIVVTGGVSAEDGTGQDYVTSYKLTDGSEKLLQSRVDTRESISRMRSIP